MYRVSAVVFDTLNSIVHIIQGISTISVIFGEKRKFFINES